MNCIFHMITDELYSKKSNRYPEYSDGRTNVIPHLVWELYKANKRAFYETVFEYIYQGIYIHSELYRLWQGLSLLYYHPWRWKNVLVVSDVLVWEEVLYYMLKTYLLEHM